MANHVTIFSFLFTAMMKIVMVYNPVTNLNDWAIQELNGEELISQEVLPATQVQTFLDQKFNISRG